MARIDFTKLLLKASQPLKTIILFSNALDENGSAKEVDCDLVQERYKK